MMMRDFELEEGEAYYLQDDDDEKIDPDKDFSYIDKKLENVLGHYQKDFMGGLSAESLGARFGGYGSFLPMQQRSPSVLCNQRIQSYPSSKSPQNLPSERINQNPTAAAANNSLPVRPGPASSDQSMQALTESGVASMNNQLKLQSSEECASNQQHKKPTVQLSDQSSLKFKVKLKSGDNAAIYSGLGLDMSPTSSLEDSPSEYEGSPPGMQEMKEDSESPSCIVKIMTSFALPDNAVLSPLHDSLVCLMQMDNNLEIGSPSRGQAHPLNVIHQSTCSEGNRDASKERKSKSKDASKERRSKHKESSKERKLKQKDQSGKSVKLVKENHEFLDDAVGLYANKMEGNATSFPKEILSKTSSSAVDARSSVFNRKGEERCSEEDTDNSMKQVWVARDKVKEEFALASSCDIDVEDEGNVNPLRGKIKKDGNSISAMRNGSSMEKRNEMVPGEEEASNLSEPPSVAKGNVKEAILEGPGVKRKEDGVGEILKDEVVGFVNVKEEAEENDKDYVVSQEMKDRSGETLEPSKQKYVSKTTPRSQVGGTRVPSGKDHSSSLGKKKPKESQTHVVSDAEPLRGAAEKEVIAVPKSIAPSKSRKGDPDIIREMRKDNDLGSIANPGKKGKEVSLKDPVTGLSERGTPTFPSKMKEKSSSKKTGFAANSGYNINMEGHLPGGNSVMENAPAGDVQQPAEVEHWVQCDKCQRWRLLPLGMNPDSLPKKWTCSMLDWLPGMNKCSFSEDETALALHALYLPPVPAPQLQTSQQAYLDGSALAGGQHAGLPNHATNVDAMPPHVPVKKNLVKKELDAARQSNSQELHIPVKKEQQYSGEIRSSKNLKKIPRESAAVRMNGDSKHPKIEKKRMADPELSGVPKKMKRVHQQCMEDPDVAGPLKPEVKVESQNHDVDPLQISRNFGKGNSKSPLIKAKNRVDAAKDYEMKDASWKKRKLKDQEKGGISTVELSGKRQKTPSSRVAGEKSDTEHRKEQKERRSNPKASSSRARDNSDNSLHKTGRKDDTPLERRHGDRAYQKTTDFRKSSEKALDMGLPENATTSSSSKVSCKVKAKVRGVKSSPRRSFSSSPLRVTKMSISHNEPDEVFSAKQLKSRAKGASNEFAPQNEESRDRKSNLSRSSACLSNATGENHSTKKLSSGLLHPSPFGIDTQPEREDYKDACGKLGQPFHEEALTSQQKLVSENQVPRSSNRLHFDETNSQKGKLHVSEIGNEKETSYHPRGVPEIEKGNGHNATRVDDRVSLRQPHPTGHVSKDIEASSSMKRDCFQWAKTALKEAKTLKRSANSLKNSGSGHESTEVFFQAALKFLHGASLLEPGNSESDRCGEVTSTEVYSTTAKLCEYCANEYERCNDMASAALAYKCMEVAYMRIVYSNDVAASRDRLELQMAVRAAPQVESPSSSASDIDNLNNQAATDTVREGHSLMDHRTHVISAGNTPNFMRLLNFAQDINLAMEASRRSQSAFAAANPILAQAGNGEVISSIKRVLDFSFHDVDGLLHLVRLAMVALGNN